MNIVWIMDGKSCFESKREWNSERERERDGCTTKQVWNCVMLINYAPGFISNIIK